MSNNINFHNRDKRPIFNCVYEGDDNLCYAHEKLRAFVGYFSISPYVENFKITDNNYGEVYLHVKNKYAIIKINSANRHIMIAPANKEYEMTGSYYNYEFYLRHTIDKLIIEASYLLVKALELDSIHQLWS